MLPAAAAILDGMPDPGDLRVARTGGEVLVFAGSVLLFRFGEGDAGARNVAVAVLRQLGFAGQCVAAAMGLTENYVATLHRRAPAGGDRRAGPGRGPAGQGGRGRVGPGAGVAGGRGA